MFLFLTFLLFDFTLFGISRSLFRSDASSLSLVEYETGCARQLMGLSIDTVIKLITYTFVLVVEKSIGTITQRVNSFFRFFCRRSIGLGMVNRS